MIRRWRTLWIAILLLLVTGLALLRYATSERFLRARLAAAVAVAGLDLVHLDRVRVSWAGAIDLQKAAFSLRPAPPPAPQASIRLEIDSASLNVSPWRLITGQAGVESLHVPAGALRVELHSRPDWAALIAAPDDPFDDDDDSLPGVPAIRFDRLDVELLETTPAGPRLLRRWIAAGSAARVSDADGDSLQFHLDQIGGSGGQRQSAQSQRIIEGSWHPGALVLSTGWLEPELIESLADDATLARLADWSARGLVRIEQLRTGDSGLELLRAGLAQASLAVPLEEPAAPAAERFFQARQLAAELQLSRAANSPAAQYDVAASANAVVNGAPTRVELSGRLTRETPQNPWHFRVHQANIRADALPFPDPTQRAALVNSPHLPGPLRAFLEDYEPLGATDVRLTIDAPAGSDPRAAGEFTLRAASCSYFQFPYRVGQIGGTVRLVEGRLELDLHGSRGAARFACIGQLNSTRQHTGFELDIRGENVALDDALRAALPDIEQELWDSAAPEGRAAVRIDMRRPDPRDPSAAEPTAVRTSVELAAGSLNLDALRRLAEAQGRVDFEGGRITIHELSGRAGTDALRLRGVVDRPSRTRDVSIESDDFVVRRDWPIPAAGAEAALRVSAHAALRGRLTGTPESPSATYQIEFRSGTLSGLCGESVWSRLRGTLDYAEPGAQPGTLAGKLHAERDSGTLELRGDVRMRENDLHAIDANIALVDSRLPDSLRILLPCAWHDWIDACGLEGAGRLDLHLRGAPAENQPLVAQVALAAATAAPRWLPLPLRELTARGHVDATGVRLEQFEARIASGGTLAVNGAIDRAADGESADRSVRGRLSFSAANVAIDPSVVGVLPAGVRSVFDAIQLSGAMHITGGRFSWDGDPGEWTLAGVFSIAGGSANLGLPLTDLDARASVEATGGAATTISTDLYVANARLNDRRIEAASARAVIQPGDPLIHFRSLRGRICDGEFEGEARVDPETGAFDLSLGLRDVNFAQFAGRTSPADGDAAPAPSGGVIDGTVFVRGQGAGSAGRRGGGELRIRGGSLLQQRVGASLLDALRMSRPDQSDALDEAVLRFTLIGEELRFEYVEFATPTQRYVGRGRWNVRSDAILLELVSAPPRGALRFAPIEDWITAASMELTYYRVTGTAAAPRVSAEALRTVTEAVRRLIRGDGL